MKRKQDMKVVLVGAYPPPFGGVQVHLVNLKKYLESRGHDCFVINLGKNKSIHHECVASPRTAMETARLLLRHRDGICHLHYGGTLHLRLILLTIFVGILFRRKCAVTIHSGGLPVWGIPSNPLKSLLIRKGFKSLERIICVNGQIARYFGSLDINKNRIKIVSPFVFDDDHSERHELPEGLRSFIERKKTVICNIGLLEPEYDLEMLLRVFAVYSGENPDSGLVMIGSGSLHAKLDRLIEDMGLTDRAMLCGDLEHRQTLQVLASSSCYVRASKYDGDCISLREAIHLGIPAIATDTGMRPPGALLFPIGSERDLISLMRETVQQNPLKKRGARQNLDALKKVESILYGLAVQGEKERK